MTWVLKTWELKLVSAIFWKLRYIKVKNLDEIEVTYLYKHYQKTNTLCRHVSRFPTLARPVVFAEKN